MRHIILFILLFVQTPRLATQDIEVDHVRDGNTPLHEWTYSESERPTTYIDPQGSLITEGKEPTEDIITWLFEAGSFVPAAKIVNNEKYSIVCDYLGTPAMSLS